MMKDESEDQRRVSRWGLPASLAVHLSIAALVIFGLPVPFSQPEEEQAMEVELVPPEAEPLPPAEQAKPEEPEQAKAEPPPAEEDPKQAESQPPPALEEAKPEDLQQPEGGPPPPAEQAKPEEPKQAEAEPPPPAGEKKPQEPKQAKAEPPPSAEEAKPEEPKQAEAEPPPPVEEAKPEEPEPAKAEPPPPAEEAKPEEPKQAKAEPPPTADEAKAEEPEQAKAGPPPSMSVLQPVFQYGEKDAGPREAPDGNSAEEGSAPPPAEPDKQEPADQPVALTAGAAGEASPGGTPDKPAASGVEIVEESVPQPEEAKRLFSQKATSNPIATTAMGNVPRGVRGGRLCVTELREQLENGLPPYYPEILPSYRLGEGTVIEIRKAAFRVGGQWYDLSYRCEVDANATKVVGFAFSVGAPLPPSEWRRRGLPSG